MSAITSKPSTLDCLRRGQCAVVEELCGSPEDCARLAAMGFCCGALVEVVAPGSPCAVKVGESRIVLRGSHTKAIQVAVIA